MHNNDNERRTGWHPLLETQHDRNSWRKQYNEERMNYRIPHNQNRFNCREAVYYKARKKWRIDGDWDKEQGSG